MKTKKNDSEIDDLLEQVVVHPEMDAEAMLHLLEDILDKMEAIKFKEDFEKEMALISSREHL